MFPSFVSTALLLILSEITFISDSEKKKQKNTQLHFILFFALHQHICFSVRCSSDFRTGVALGSLSSHPRGEQLSYFSGFQASCAFAQVILQDWQGSGILDLYTGTATHRGGRPPTPASPEIWQFTRLWVNTAPPNWRNTNLNNLIPASQTTSGVRLGITMSITFFLNLRRREIPCKRNTGVIQTL